MLVRCIDSHTPFAIGDALRSSRSRCPTTRASRCSTSFSDGAARLGVVTDLGTRHRRTCEDKLSGCEALVIECNHDLDMLMNGAYPAGLKQRIAGRFGHLDNADAGRLVAASTARSCATSSRRISRSRTTRRRSPSRRSRGRRPASRDGSAWRGRRTGSPGGTPRRPISRHPQRRKPAWAGFLLVTQRLTSWCRPAWSRRSCRPERRCGVVAAGRVGRGGGRGHRGRGVGGFAASRPSGRAPGRGCGFLAAGGDADGEERGDQIAVHCLYP